MNTDTNKILRVVFVGDMRTGKTTLINRISNPTQITHSISDELVEYDYTMGVDFFVLHIDDKKNANIRLLWKRKIHISNCSLRQ